MKLRIRRVILVVMLLCSCFAGAAAPFAEAVTLNPGDLIVADANRFIEGAPPLVTPGAVIKINPQTGDQELISEGENLIPPIGIAIHPDGGIIVIDRDLPGIVRVEPVPPHAQTVLSRGGLLPDPIGLAVNQSTGEIIVAVPTLGVVGVSLLGQRLISAITGISQFFGVAIEPSGSIVVADLVGRAVLRINPTTGAQTIVSSGELLNMGPIGVAIDRDGSIIVGGGMFSGPNAAPPTGIPAVVRIDPETGAQQAISLGGSFVNPYWVAVEADGSIIVSDQEAFGPPNPISGTRQGALFRVNPATGEQTLISAGGNLGDPNGVAIVPGIIPPPPPPVVPVVLVHGWCGSPSEFTWGQTLSLLQLRGLTGDYARYPTDSEPDLARLAGYLRSEVSRILNDPILNPANATQVDIVTHSMGGLVTRAWIAGMAIDEVGQVHYNNEVRRLIMAASPHYGVPFRAFQAGLLSQRLGLCSALRPVRRSQATQMEFGSHFLWVLHQKWSTTPFAHDKKHDVLTIVGTGFDPTDASDSVVPIASATLSDPDVRARYVDRGHFSSIVEVDEQEHETFELVSSFITATDPRNPEADACELPTCRKNPDGDAPGMILTRLVREDSGDGINLRGVTVVVDFEPAPQIPGDLRSCTELTLAVGCIVNPRASTLTITQVSPGKYDVTLTVENRRRLFPKVLFGPGALDEGVAVSAGRTSVPGEAVLPRAPRRP